MLIKFVYSDLKTDNFTNYNIILLYYDGNNLN